ncbi:hypothetical protein ACNKHO_12070 [Shigella flexneri]
MRRRYDCISANGQSQLLSQLTQRLTLTDAHFRRIRQLIYQRAGIVLADHKRDMVYNRLVRRLRTLTGGFWSLSQPAGSQ